MNRKLCNISLFLVVSCLSLLQHNIHAIKYVVINTVPNHPGGKVFDNEIGVEYTLSIMPDLAEKIFQIFEQKTQADRRDVPVMNVFISDFDGYAYKNDNNINISARALDQYYHPRDKSKYFFKEMLIHEMTHVLQWHGNFGAPGGLTEGMADYVMVKSGLLYNPDTYTKPGDGKRWDEGYGVTERFLEYCDSVSPKFFKRILTPTMNRRMRREYKDLYWKELLLKPVDQLWREYKAKYGNKPQQEDGEEEEYFNGQFHGLEY